MGFTVESYWPHGGLLAYRDWWWPPKTFSSGADLYVNLSVHLRNDAGMFGASVAARRRCFPIAGPGLSLFSIAACRSAGSLRVE